MDTLFGDKRAMVGEKAAFSGRTLDTCSDLGENHQRPQRTNVPGKRPQTVLGSGRSIYDNVDNDDGDDGDDDDDDDVGDDDDDGDDDDGDDDDD